MDFLEQKILLLLEVGLLCEAVDQVQFHAMVTNMMECRSGQGFGFAFRIQDGA